MAKKKTKVKRRKAAGNKLPDEVTFDYIKSSSHRVILVSGAHGGPTIDARFIHMSVFNERQPIPQKEVFGVDAKGRILGLKRRHLRETNVVREVEATLMFDINTAALIQKWLGQQIEKIHAVEKMKKKQARKS